MTYDPKKKRPKREDLDAVVDEIFGDEPVKKKSPSKKAVSKKSTSATSDKKSNVTPISQSPKKPTAKTRTSTSDESEKIQDPKSRDDNILPLYPEAEDTPLIMQPQVWLATGIAAVLVLFLAKRRKKR